MADNMNSKPRKGVRGIKPKAPNVFKTKTGMTPYGNGQSVDSKKVYGGSRDGSAGVSSNKKQVRNINKKPRTPYGFLLGTMVGSSLKKYSGPRKGPKPPRT